MSYVNGFACRMCRKLCVGLCRLCRPVSAGLCRLCQPVSRFHDLAVSGLACVGRPVSAVSGCVGNCVGLCRLCRGYCVGVCRLCRVSVSGRVAVSGCVASAVSLCRVVSHSCVGPVSGPAQMVMWAVRMRVCSSTSSCTSNPYSL